MELSITDSSFCFFLSKQRSNILIRALVVDDHPFVRRAVRRLLERSGDMEVVGEASDGESALEEVDRLEPDVVLLDLRMPRMDGLAVLKALKEGRWQPKVVILTMNGRPGARATALAAGAAAFVSKQVAVEELLPAIRAAVG